jgi:hypothetical protein
LIFALVKSFLQFLAVNIVQKVFSLGLHNDDECSGSGFWARWGPSQLDKQLQFAMPKKLTSFGIPAAEFDML